MDFMKYYAINMIFVGREMQTSILIRSTMAIFT